MSLVSITNLQNLPKISGIYKVLDDKNNVLYIGQAKNIYQRWNNGHHKMNEILSRCGANAYVESVEVPEWLLNRAENAAISFYKPALNRRNPPVV